MANVQKDSHKAVNTVKTVSKKSIAAKKARLEAGFYESELVETKPLPIPQPSFREPQYPSPIAQTPINEDKEAIQTNGDSFPEPSDEFPLAQRTYSDPFAFDMASVDKSMDTHITKETKTREMQPQSEVLRVIKKGKLQLKETIFNHSSVNILHIPNQWEIPLFLLSCGKQITKHEYIRKLIEQDLRNHGHI